MEREMCGNGAAGRGRRRAAAVVLMALLVVPPPVSGQQPDRAEIWRTFAASLPPGSDISLRLADGTRASATLLGVSADGMDVQPKTRVPVPPQRVRFADVVALERQKRGGTSVGKAIAIGAASAAGAFVGFLLVAFAVLGD